MNWTRKLTNRIRREYPYCKDPRLLAEKLGVTYKALESRAKRLGLRRKFVANLGRSKATRADDQFIKDNYLTMGLKTIASHLGYSESLIKGRMKFFKLVIPEEVIERFKGSSQFKKGHEPMTKGKKQTEYMSKEAIERTKATRFKKGDLIHNELSDGAVTIRRNIKRGYAHKYIRISKSVWKELQIYNWEKKYGPVPKGFVLACKDGNTLNCKSSNWYLLNMADNAIRNSGSLNLTDGYVAFTIVGKNNMHLYDDVLKNKKLIELKRQQIKLKRAINEQQKVS